MALFKTPSYEIIKRDIALSLKLVGVRNLYFSWELLLF